MGPRPRPAKQYTDGLYVVHFPLELVMPRLGESVGAELLYMAGGFLLSIATAVPLWHFFEAPILSLKRYFEYDRMPAAGRWQRWDERVAG